MKDIVEAAQQILDDLTIVFDEVVPCYPPRHEISVMFLMSSYNIFEVYAKQVHIRFNTLVLNMVANPEQVKANQLITLRTKTCPREKFSLSTWKISPLHVKKKIRAGTNIFFTWSVEIFHVDRRIFYVDVENFLVDRGKFTESLTFSVSWIKKTYQPQLARLGISEETLGTNLIETLEPLYDVYRVYIKVLIHLSFNVCAEIDGRLGTQYIGNGSR